MKHIELEKFNQLYEKTYPAVLKYVVCHCQKIEDIEDLIQTIYLGVYKNIKKIPSENALSYVLGISKNKVNSFYRFSYRKQKTEKILMEEIPSTFHLEEELLKKYEIDFVWEYLKTKPILIFQIFYLYFQQDYTIKEIAQELHLTESNVKNYLYRTIKELQKKEENHV